MGQSGSSMQNSEYVKKSDINIPDLSGYVKSDILAEYAKKSEVTGYVKSDVLAEYAKKSEVANEYVKSDVMDFYSPKRDLIEYKEKNLVFQNAVATGFTMLGKIMDSNGTEIFLAGPNGGNLIAGDIPKKDTDTHVSALKWDKDGNVRITGDLYVKGKKLA